MAWRERRVVGRSTPIIMEQEDHLSTTTTFMKSYFYVVEERAIFSKGYDPCGVFLTFSKKEPGCKTNLSSMFCALHGSCFEPQFLFCID
jgi:hypothetical protein